MLLILPAGNLYPAVSGSPAHVVLRNGNAGRATPEDVVTFAESLLGIRYRYGSADPEKGFDCSGFVHYVLNHFGLDVPRSSSGFAGIGETVSLKEARRGDLILFTGTKSTRRNIGHIGIITSKTAQSTSFIHSTSGKAYGVTVTQLNKYYQGRFVKVVRLFN